jgi:predicted Ser/Thr protein kinase
VSRRTIDYNWRVSEMPVGEVFAGYRIEQLAGRGGMGIVYRATDLSLDRPVAIKFISADLSNNAAFRRRFESESKTAASLDHPNVIPIYYAGEHDDALFLVMRYVEGEDLRDVVATQGPLEASRGANIVAQVASALDAAHGAGLVHRDVKPANILLGASDHAYLTDFGLSKRLIADTQETQTGHLMGTFDYVAPEQIRGGTIGPYTDVYALGCVLYYALTGRVPFPVPEQEAKLWAHLSEAPPPLGAGYPTALDAVIARAMEKEPANRFPSAGALGEAAVAAVSETRRSEPVSVERPVPASPAPPAPTPEPVSRGDLRVALVRNALLSPFCLALLAATLLAGLIFGELLIAVPAGVAIYAAAAAVVYLDDDVQQRVLKRERAKRGLASGAPSAPDSPAESLSPRIQNLLDRAAEKQARIRDAIDRAELPYAEVSDEVDRLMTTIAEMARRAELLREGLADAPPGQIAHRISTLEAERDPSREPLIDALRAQLEAQRRVEQQLNRFFDRIEGVLVEFDTIRGHLVSVSASTDADNQRRLAAQVQGLREQAGAVADGMAAAYSDSVAVEADGR